MTPQSHFFNRMLFAVFLLVLAAASIESSRFLVKTLPGFDGDLPFTLETGYVGVGESELFYYFIESEGNPDEDPVMLWLTGGPGCSSIFGLMYELGPLTFNTEISTVEMPILDVVTDSLTKVASIIFLDQPAGSGYSYAKTPEAYITNDTFSAIQVYDFLKKWFVDHPKFLKNPLYLGADSYMGIVLPMIVQEIYNGNEVGEGLQINIKGYILGNPLTDRSGDYNSRIQYAHNMALLSDAIYESTKENCQGEYLNVDPNNSLCIHDLEVVDKCLGNLNTAQILESNCRASNTLKSDKFRRALRTSDQTSMDILPQAETQFCREDNYKYFYAWCNRRDVREALQTSEVLENIEWVDCNETMHFYFDAEATSYTHNVVSSVGYHRSLVDKNCRALVYSGDHDMVIPYLSTLSWIESLNLSVIDSWRPWSVDNQVAGYTQKYSKDDYDITFATVKGGGHTAPEYKHKECIRMLKRWLTNNAL